MLRPLDRHTQIHTLFYQTLLGMDNIQELYKNSGVMQENQKLGAKRMGRKVRVKGDRSSRDG